MRQSQPLKAFGIAAAIFLAGVSGVPAQDLPKPIIERQSELESITAAISKAQEDRSAVEAEIQALEIDTENTNRRLIEIARTIQDKERSVQDLEDKMSALGAEEAEIRGKLSARREVLAHLIAALQRLGRNPPPAILAHPEDALSSVRSAIALGAVLPEVRDEAFALLNDLEALAEIQKTTRESQVALENETEALSAEQAELALLVEAKRRQVLEEQQGLIALNTEVERLSETASSLEDLISGMKDQLAEFRALNAERFASDAEVAEEAAGIAPEQLQSYFAAQEQAQTEEERERIENPLIAKSDPGRLKPALPFTRAKGLLPLPARGVILTRFGEDDGFGSPSEGLSIGTRRSAQVVAPADGWVVFAGPFRSFGKLLIVDVGEDHHIVLAGMERINVTEGQFILAGEPIGVMGSRPVRVATTALTGGNAQPLLYVELRQDGTAIDSSPWWSEDTMRVGG